ncbi:MAG: serine/threonine-protein kinase [Phormidesmis sp.]
MSDPNTGRKISNRYNLIEPIGQGSMGRVYLAADSLLGDVPVAVKFLSQTMLNENMRTRFFREAMTCAQLGQKSMHVVRVTDYGLNEEDVPFYVMEYLKGDSVGRLLRKQPLPVPRFLGIVRQILLGLRTAHNGILVNGEAVPIIHRDIKPNNVIVTSDPSMGELVKILDFGIAKLLQAGSEQTSTFMGTLAYASPEQMEGRELDNRSDIYSLGVMMYQMLSGSLPVKPENNTFGSWYKAHRLLQPKLLAEFELELKVPKALENIVMACLAKQRENRPDDIQQVIDAIAPLEDRFGSGLQISQRINTTLSKLPVVKEIQPKKALTLVPQEEAIAEKKSPAEYSFNRRREKQHREELEDDSQEAAKSAVRVLDLPSANSFYLAQTWPAEMPIAQIVFPRLLEKQSEMLPTLWAMMPTAEIEMRMGNTRYNNFMCTMAPHPMVLWLTVLYNKRQGPRWLPCYLDLKSKEALQIIEQLANARKYHLMFFEKENSNRCRHAQPINIAASQRRLFQDWTNAAQTFPTGDLQNSKALLRRELENNLKPKILMNFESMHSDDIPGMDSSLGF